VSSQEYAESCALSDVSGALDKLEVVPFGIDLEIFRPGRDEAFRESLGLSADEPVLFFIGGLDRAHYFKGLPVLIEALEGLKEKPWKLVVAGDGDLRDIFVAQARTVGLTDRILFIGSIAEADKPRAYRAADIHVFPSIDRSEAFGLVALEAAASGIPCVASSLPGVRSVVKHEETGLLVESEKPVELRAAIERLLDDHELRVRLGASARARAEREFAWSPLISRLEMIYKKVLQNSCDS
jgi:glycosyltransferase involved in cell wall biosynthesis